MFRDVPGCSGMFHVLGFIDLFRGFGPHILISVQVKKTRARENNTCSVGPRCPVHRLRYACTCALFCLLFERLCSVLFFFVEKLL